MDELKDTLQKIEVLLEESLDNFYFNNVSTVNEILDFEVECDIVLPHSFHIFLNHFNGGFISKFPKYHINHQMPANILIL